MLVAAREEKRELVAAETERLAALPQARRELREHAVPDRMPEAVVDLLEVVDVEEEQRQAEALALRLVEVALQALVEVTVVAEARERVGQREPHRAKRAVHRALVERDRDERADERDRGAASAPRGRPA